MRKECDFSKGLQGKHASQAAQGPNIIRLDPDVADVFHDLSLPDADELLAKSKLAIAIEAKEKGSWPNPARSSTIDGTGSTQGVADYSRSSDRFFYRQVDEVHNTVGFGGRCRRSQVRRDFIGHRLSQSCLRLARPSGNKIGFAATWRRTRCIV